MNTPPGGGPTVLLSRVAVSLYLQEALELAGALDFRLTRLEQARDRWLAGQDTADAQLAREPDDFDTSSFNEALSGSAHAQGEIFDEIEAFLAAWARLSLLFWPQPRRNAPNRGFTLERGRVLRAFLRLDDSHPLYDRDLRNAWMHTDERFDDAWMAGHLGNRQQFVRSREVPAAVQHSVRVVDVETLTVHFRDNAGALRSRALLPLRTVLADLKERRLEAFRHRLQELPPHR